MSASDPATNGDMVFDDLEPKHVTVRLKYAGRVEVYTLHEATEDASVKAENHRYRNAKATEDGRLSAADGLFDAPAYLVSLCLRDDKGNPVPEAKVRSFRPDVVRKLHRWIQDNSGLAPADTIAVLEERIANDTRALERLRRLANGSLAKNSQGATAAT